MHLFRKKLYLCPKVGEDLLSLAFRGFWTAIYPTFSGVDVGLKMLFALD